MFSRDGMSDFSYQCLFSINYRLSNHYFLWIYLSFVQGSFAFATIRYVVCVRRLVVVFHANVKKNLSPNNVPSWLKIIISWCQKATIVVVILVVFVFTIIAIIVSVFVIDVCLCCCFWVVRGVLLRVWTWWYNGCLDNFWSSYSMFSLFIYFSLVFLNLVVIKSLS